MGYTAAMSRRLVWIATQNFEGFGCSECDWLFKPSGVLGDDSLDEMKKKYEAQRDKEFDAHVCEHPRIQETKHPRSPLFPHSRER
jgi:hypothetical protein